jgi:xylan 1,4-beta-xylosidase
VFRMGYSEKDNRVEPPSDNDKWADVMVQVIKHYNAGWADGFQWNIKYWEVWNEPSGLGWTGTPLEYCKLYEATVNKIKKYDSTLMVGGPALGGPSADKDREFAEFFIKYCAEHRLPLDFFSWHVYFNRPQEQIEHAERHRRMLNASGFAKARMFLTEWGWLSGVTYPPPAEDLASIRDAAADVSAMAVLHDRVDMAHFYLGGSLVDYPWGLFDFVRQDSQVTVKPRKSFFAFKAFNLLAQGSVRLQCQAAPTVDEGGCAVLASKDETGKTVAVLLSNYGTDVKHYTVTVSNLPWTTPTSLKVFALDSTRNLDVVRESEEQRPSGAPVELDVENPSVCLMTLTRAKDAVQDTAR